MKRITTMTDHIKNEAEVEENNMKVKKINQKKNPSSTLSVIGFLSRKSLHELIVNAVAINGNRIYLSFIISLF